MINHHLFVRENKPVTFSEETLGKIRLLLKRYPEGQQRSAILPVLHIAQQENGGYTKWQLSIPCFSWRRSGNM
jgi:NADH:ubiquinone oxidoreductase subunit E